MFRKEMQEKLHRIFGLAKTTYDAPSESFEQDTLFIHVEEAKNRVTQGKAFSKVSASIAVFSQDNKLPFGFFHKRISQADLADTRDFLFTDFDVDVAQSPARLQNIHERRARFTYLYQAQYDPNQGELTEVEFGG